MYDHILLPVEIGGPGEIDKAKAVAETLLSKSGRLTLLYVVTPIPQVAQAYIATDISQEIASNARERLTEEAERLQIKDKVLLTGPVGRHIVGWADENSVDCIVMASHTPEFSDIFLGSTAAWVVRHAKCSVHVLR